MTTIGIHPVRPGSAATCLSRRRHHARAARAAMGGGRSRRGGSGDRGAPGPRPVRRPLQLAGRLIAWGTPTLSAIEYPAAGLQTGENMKRILFAAVAACAVSAAIPALADVTYTYVGQPLLPYNSDDPNYGTSTVYAPINIALVFSDDGSSLLSWSASEANVGTINDADAANIPAASGLEPWIDLDTDGSGNVIAWYVSVYSQFLGMPPGRYQQSELSLSGQAAGSPATPQPPVDSSVLITDTPNPFGFIAINHSAPGTWTSTGGTLDNLVYISPSFVVPPAGPIPEPSSLAMLALGVTAIAFRPRLKRRVPATRT